MGLSYEELGDTTPIELDELQRQFVMKLDRENQRFGLLTAAMYNAARTDKSQKVFQPTDFFPVLSIEQDDQEEPEPKAQQELAAASQDHRATILDDFWMVEKTASKIRASQSQGLVPA